MTKSNMLRAIGRISSNNPSRRVPTECFINVSMTITENIQNNTQITFEDNKRETIKSFRSKKNRCRSCKLCEWKHYKAKLDLFFLFGLDVISNIYNFGLTVMKNPILYLLDQLGNFTILCVLTYLLIFAKSTHDDEMMIPFGVISLIVYIIVQNLYYAFLKGKIDSEECWDTRDQAIQSLCILYMFLDCGSIFSSIVIIFYVSGKYIDLTIYMSTAIIFRLIFDTFIIQITCPILLIFLMVTYVFGILSYFLGFILEFVFIKHCKNMTKEMKINENKKNIQHILDKISWKFHNRINKENQLQQPCAICLEDLYDAYVVTLDCDPQHIFHKKCIMDWLTCVNECPLCKIEVIPQEIYHTIINN